MVIRTLAPDEWVVTFGTARRGLGGKLHIIQSGTIIASAVHSKGLRVSTIN